MGFAWNLPLFSIVLCLLASAASALLSDRAARRVTLCLCAAVAAMAVPVLIGGVRTGLETEYRMGHYPRPWGNELSFGVIEPLLVLLFALIFFLCLVGGKRQLEADLAPGKRNLYYVMCDLVLVSLLSLAYTNDVFTGYVFIEICTLSSCGLLMIRQIGRTTLAATRYMIFSLIGSGLFLLGVVLLYAITGQLLMPNLREAITDLYRSGRYRTVLITGMSLMTFGLGVKSGLFPFHFWMPDTYGYATPASAGVLSGLVSKGYIFFLMKVIYRAFGTEAFYGSGVSNLLYVFGACGIVVGSISALKENDMLRMVAFSSAAQIGYIYMGVGISPALGCLAAVFHILTHAVTKPMLFLASAELSDAAGGGDRGRLRENWRGAAHANRMAGLAFAIGACSMIGIPLTMGFVSKYRFALAAFERARLIVPTLTVLAVSTVLNVFYFARAVIRLYTPAEGETPRIPIGLNPTYSISAIAMIVMNIAAGVAAEPLVLLLERGLSML